VWEDGGMAVTRDMQGRTATDGRLEQALLDAAAFFEAYLWESERTSAARDLLAKRGLREQVIRAFGVGYAPGGPDVMTGHLEGLGYSPGELEAAGLGRRPARGPAPAPFRVPDQVPGARGQGPGARVRGARHASRPLVADVGDVSRDDPLPPLAGGLRDRPRRARDRRHRRGRRPTGLHRGAVVPPGRRDE